jgi:ABC-2 type transport system ATP-binding protein
VLEFEDLSPRFGTLQALDHLTFLVPSGEVFGFLGPNGAGKTTAMPALFGLVSLDAGQVRWKGAAVTAVERHRFGYLPEERGLCPGMVVFDQLVYLARLHDLSAADARAAATRWLERLGIAGRRGAKAEALSLGNQQGVQLAAAKVHGPELLVLDEPFSGLDPTGIEVLAGSSP